MFSDVINTTPFVTAEAEYVFGQKVPLLSYTGDVSLTSTLRALIAPRMAEGTRLEVIMNSCRGDIVREFDLQYISGMRDCFYVISQTQVDEGWEQTFDRAKEILVSEAFGFEELPSIEAFFAKSFKIKCFVNRETRLTLVIVHRLDLKKLHLMQTALLVMMPWYHGPRESLSDDEFDLIKSLKEPKSDKYYESLERLAAKYDFRKVKIERLLANYETVADRQRCEQIKRELTNVDQQIKNWDSAIKDYITKRNEYLATLRGLNDKIAESENGGSSDFMNYIIRNKHVDVIDARDGWVKFTATTFFEFYDEDLAERIINNKHSDLYCKAPNAEYAEGMAKLMRKVFVDGELKMQTIAAYQMTAGRGVDGLSNFAYGGKNSQYCIPNPHIHYYACLGNYSRVLNKLIAENDYIGVIDQCLASVKSLNWGDPPVMGRFFSDLYGDYDTCIQLPDGSMVKPSEAIAWIKAQETSDGEETEAENE